jgi:hypothetical protein
MIASNRAIGLQRPKFDVPQTDQMPSTSTILGRVLVISIGTIGRFK